jgi:molecular chaperone Hsp33
MIMERPSDLLTRACATKARIQLAYVEVTDAARALERSHLSGPTATLALAEALAGVALLGAELTRPQETVTLRLRVTGPVEGLLVEAAADGSLRGYTNVKVLNDLDGREELDSSEAFGDRAEVQILRSEPGRILGHATFETRPASVRAAIEQYYRQSLQRRAAAQLTAVAYGGTLDQARGVLALAMPDTPDGEFERLAALFEDQTAAEELEACDSLEELAGVLGAGHLECEPPRRLRFACRCSPARVAGMLDALDEKDLAAMAAAGKPTAITCHMCGRGYAVEPAEIAQRLARKRKT